MCDEDVVFHSVPPGMAAFAATNVNRTTFRGREDQGIGTEKDAGRIRNLAVVQRPATRESHIVLVLEHAVETYDARAGRLVNRHDHLTRVQDSERPADCPPVQHASAASTLEAPHFENATIHPDGAVTPVALQ
jgi:hypothetical protein